MTPTKYINNFTGSNAIGIGTVDPCGSTPRTVALMQSAGSLSFYFHMLPEQARAMAKALTEAAAEAEAA